MEVGLEVVYLRMTRFTKSHEILGHVIAMVEIDMMPVELIGASTSFTFPRVLPNVPVMRIFLILGIMMSRPTAYHRAGYSFLPGFHGCQ